MLHCYRIVHPHSDVKQAGVIKSSFCCVVRGWDMCALDVAPILLFWSMPKKHSDQTHIKFQKNGRQTIIISWFKSCIHSETTATTLAGCQCSYLRNQCDECDAPSAKYQEQIEQPHTKKSWYNSKIIVETLIRHLERKWSFSKKKWALFSLH